MTAHGIPWHIVTAQGVPWLDMGGANGQGITYFMIHIYILTVVHIVAWTMGDTGTKSQTLGCLLSRVAYTQFQGSVERKCFFAVSGLGLQ